MQLRIVPLKLREANALVAALHRHHQPVRGHRFSIGVVDMDGVVHGACIVGRPVARHAGHERAVLEVTRLVTDGTPNACSMLYSAAARAGACLGYSRIQTYILESEPGTSLRASGWQDEGLTRGGDWNRQGRVRRTDQPMERKRRWARVLGEEGPTELIVPGSASPR